MFFVKDVNTGEFVRTFLYDKDGRPTRGEDGRLLRGGPRPFSEPTHALVVARLRASLDGGTYEVVEAT